MRVIAGKARGRVLFSPRGSRVRPTSDRVKEALFNMIAPQVMGAKVLDLFAGSGALGIEALSRGAKEVVFVDKHGSSVALIEKNLAAVGFVRQARVYRMGVVEAISVLDRLGEGFDVVLLDPPYGEGLSKDVLVNLDQSNLIKPQGLVVVEHSRLEEAIGVSLVHLQPRRVRRYGDTLLSYFTWDTSI